jgi:hypothetical protein
VILFDLCYSCYLLLLSKFLSSMVFVILIWKLRFSWYKGTKQEQEESTKKFLLDLFFGYCSALDDVVLVVFVFYEFNSLDCCF